MKKILFFAVMFCVALSTTMLVSCGDDDDDTSSSQKDNNIFTSEIKVTDDLLALYKDIKVYYKLPDGSEIANDVKSTNITFEHILTGGKKVEVRFTGTLNEDIVQDDKTYNLFIIYKGKLGAYSRAETLGGYAPGKGLKDLHKELGTCAGYVKHTYNMELPASN